MQRLSLYRLLTFLALGAAATAGVLAGVAFGLSHAFEAGAAALCALVFVVPGLLFFRYSQRLASRDLALVHVARVAEEAGVADAEMLAKALDVPAADATKIVRIAIREGRLQGEVDGAGRFVSANAPRCASCGTALPRKLASGPCPSCGASTAGGR